MGNEFIERGDISLLSFYYLCMKTLKESILTSIVQGDRYFEKLYHTYHLDPRYVKMNKDGSIDYMGSVHMVGEHIEKIELRFNYVKGAFDISRCINLKTLENCPKKVGGDFKCTFCRNLKNLIGGPEWVGGEFDCSICTGLESLEGSPQELRSGFYCNSCTRLKTLKGGPRKVYGTYDCSCSGVETLEGVAVEVGGILNCTLCEDLITLDYLPRKIGGALNLMDCDNLASWFEDHEMETHIDLENYLKKIGVEVKGKINV